MTIYATRTISLPTSFTTIFGKIRLKSTYLRGSNGSVNTSRSLNIRHKGRSPVVEEALVDFGSDHSFDQAAIKFKRHYKFVVSDATIRHTTESMGKNVQNFIHTKLEKFEKDDSQNIVSNKPLEKVFLGVDGASVRTGQLEPIVDQTLKTPSGRVKCKRMEGCPLSVF